MIQSPFCPDASRWQALLADADAADSAELESHLSGCSRCQQVLDDVAVGSSGWLRDANRLATKNGDEMEMTRTLHRLRDEFPDDHVVPPIALDFLKPSDLQGVLGTLGRYQVLEVIGRGAFGIVLKALDPDLLRPVAIKVLAPYLAPSGTARQRFLREARAAAAVSHDHVVTIHAVEPADGLPYLVMEYITGVSLQGRLDRDGPLPPRDIARIGLQAANGLSAAHAMGLVHRDIKPANILLENGVERVKITDFGLARAADDARLTQSGVAAGTPLYMSPEQARGEAVDGRSDLFSLGSVLYTLATGFPPFRADSTMGVLNRITNHPPRPIRETIPDFPAELEKIIMQLLEKEPGKRFQLSADVSFRLGAFLSNPQAQTTPAVEDGSEEEPPEHTNKWVVALCLLAAAAMIAIVLTFRTPKGTLIVEVDDPAIKVALDGEELKITGAGPQEVRLKPGDYHVSASKDGKPAKVSQEIVTITKDGKQVVKVSIQPELPGVDSDTSLGTRINAVIPDADPARIELMKLAWTTSKAKIEILHIANARPSPQTHASFPQLQKRMIEAKIPDASAEQIRLSLREGYALAGAILEDTEKARTAFDSKNLAKGDPDWVAKLNVLEGRFDAIMKSFPLSRQANQDATLNERVIRMQKLLTQFQELRKRSWENTTELSKTNAQGAGSTRQKLQDQLEADYPKMLDILMDLEKVAVELGARPALPAPVTDPFAAAQDWESRQKKLVRDFNALIVLLAKTRPGSVLLITGPMGDPVKATAGLSDADVVKAKRMLAIRDQFALSVPLAQKALDRWEKAQLDCKNKNVHHDAGTISALEWEQAKLELRQADRALQNSEDTLTALKKDFEAIAKEVGVLVQQVSDDFEAVYKKVMAEYDALTIRLAKTQIGRLLATIPSEWSQRSVVAELGNDDQKCTLGTRLLTLRDRLMVQSRNAEAALAHRARSIAEKKNEDKLKEFEESVRKDEQDVKFYTATVRGIVDELKKLADEIDPPAKKPSEPSKGPGQ